MPKRGPSDRERGLLNRRDLLRGAGALAGLSLLGASSRRARGGASTFANRSYSPSGPLPPEWASEWMCDCAPMGPIRAGNDVMELIRGPQTFREMINIIQTASRPPHFIYLIGWTLFENFSLDGFTPSTQFTVMSMFRRAVMSNVQVRVLLNNSVGNDIDGVAVCNRINALQGRPPPNTIPEANTGNGGCIVDRKVLNFGCHHQKILIVYGAVNGVDTLQAMCGGIDINPDRYWARNTGANRGSTEGTPFEDIHCKITGPAARDLLRLFCDRWEDQPRRAELPVNRRSLRGLHLLAEPMPPAAGSCHVQIGRTFGNLTRHNHPGDGSGGAPYAFARNGEQTAARMILRAIGKAKFFIYVEDQYWVETQANAVGLNFVLPLARALEQPTFQHLTLLVPHSRINTLAWGCGERRSFLNNIRAQCVRDGFPAAANKIRVYAAPDPDVEHFRHAYVHSKTWVFDDEFAVIGSANMCRRSMTHDSEVTAGVYDPSAARMPHRLRQKLWAQALNPRPSPWDWDWLDHSPSAAMLAAVNDGLASATGGASGAGLWPDPTVVHPNPAARVGNVQTYDESINQNDPGAPNVPGTWATHIDPDGS
jgi:phosphatidylserine/phosphatidylglycerophosphate/cardiolipin synthase-like enzyme